LRIFDTKGSRHTPEISPKSLAARSRRLLMRSLPCEFNSAKIKRKGASEFFNSIRRTRTFAQLLTLASAAGASSPIPAANAEAPNDRPQNAGHYLQE
jgi:hypothetical protein